VDLFDRLKMDVPIVQAGMGGGLAGPPLASAVARAGGLGTLGWVPGERLRESIRRMREGADDRAVAVNLLMPFVRRHDVEVWIEERIDVAVVAFGGDSRLVGISPEARRRWSSCPSRSGSRRAGRCFWPAGSPPGRTHGRRWPQAPMRSSPGPVSC